MSSWPLYPLLALLEGLRHSTSLHHLQCRLFQVECHGIEHKFHVSFLKATVSHPGEPVLPFQGPDALLNDIAGLTDKFIDAALNKGKRSIPGSLVHDAVSIPVVDNRSVLLAAVSFISEDKGTFR